MLREPKSFVLFYFRLRLTDFADEGVRIFFHVVSAKPIRPHTFVGNFVWKGDIISMNRLLTSFETILFICIKSLVSNALQRAHFSFNRSYVLFMKMSLLVET